MKLTEYIGLRDDLSCWFAENCYESKVDLIGCRQTNNDRGI